MHHILSSTSASLSALDPTDPITACPSSVLALLPSNPNPLIALAHAKLHTFPYESVPVCWRRLYTDASIANAIALIRRNIGINKRADDGDGNGERRRGSSACGQEAVVEEEGGGGEEGWVDEVVKILDMASIMAGAVGREDMIERILDALQRHLEHHRTAQEEEEEEASPPPGKRQKLENTTTRIWDSFPVAAEDVDSPIVRFPMSYSIAPTMQEFETHMRSSGGQPLLIKDALTHWPAMHERPWSSPKYLLHRTFGGRRLIPVEIGRSYTDAGWGQSIITFKEFMERYMMASSSSSAKGGEEGGGAAGDDDSGVEKTGYLAQHDLLAQIPALRNDIAIPDYCYTDPPPMKFASENSGLLISGAGKAAPPLPQLEEPLLNAWFGPAGTVSPLHTDPYHNILCQIVGKKYVRLYSPSQTRKLYPKGEEGGGVDMSNTSEVDAEASAEELDADFPLFRQAEYVETILGEGECLYIPVGWWHYVRSLSVSFSVSFWWN